MVKLFHTDMLNVTSVTQRQAEIQQTIPAFAGLAFLYFILC